MITQPPPNDGAMADVRKAISNTILKLTTGHFNHSFQAIGPVARAT